MTSQPRLDTDTRDPEDIITELDIRHLVIEDETPVDNFQSEEQQRLLVEPLYSAKPRPFSNTTLVEYSTFQHQSG